jgi:hypothetical protein
MWPQLLDIHLPRMTAFAITGNFRTGTTLRKKPRRRYPSGRSRPGEGVRKRGGAGVWPSASRAVSRPCE